MATEYVIGVSTPATWLPVTTNWPMHFTNIISWPQEFSPSELQKETLAEFPVKNRKDAEDFITRLKEIPLEVGSANVLSNAERLDKCCVGGKFAIYLRKRAGQSWQEALVDTRNISNFPPNHVVRSILCLVNPRLKDDVAATYARDLTRANDHHDYEGAYDKLQAALLYGCDEQETTPDTIAQ